jgi:TP901 family phage tail tape measure protein
MVQSARSNRESWDRAGRTMTAFGTATLAGLAVAARAAVNWESQWTGVLKTVNGTDAELGALEESLREMARTLPATHEEIAAVAEAAGQLGIQTPNVAAFTRTMIDLGETTNLSAEEAATGLARFANVMGTSQGDFDRLGSVIVGLGNNFATTEREILDMAQRLASASRVVGLTEADTLALATAMSSVGIEAEAGGSAISRVLIKISSAVETGGADLDEFARTAGMSSADFAQKWRTAPVDALLSVVGGLAQMTATGSGTFTMLDELGLRDVRITNAMLSLSNATDLTNRAVAQSSDEWERNSALLIEAQKRYDTAAARIEVAKGSINDAAITLGQVFLPAVADAAEGVAGFAQWVGSLPAPVQQAAGGIAALAGSAALAGGAFLMLFPRVIETIGAFREMGEVAQVSWKRVGAIGGAALVVGGLLKLADAMQTVSVSGEEMLNRLLAIEEGAADVGSTFDDIGQGWADNLSLMGRIDTGSVDDFRESLERLNNARAAGWISDFNNMMNDIAGMDGGLRQLGIRLGDVGGVLGTLAVTDLPRAVTQFNKFVDAAGGGEDAVRLLLERMPDYRDALYSAATAQGLVLDETSLLAAATGELSIVQDEATGVQEDLGVEYETTTGTIEGQSDALKDLIALLEEQSGVVKSEMEAQAGLEAAYDAATKSIEDNGATLDITTEAGRANQDALIAIRDAGYDVVASMEANGATQGELQSSMAITRDRFLDTAEAMGMARSDAEDLADQMGLIPQQINTTINVTDEEARLRLDRFVEAYTNRTIPMTIALRADTGAMTNAQYAAFTAAYDRSGSRRSGGAGGFAYGGQVPGVAPHPRADNVMIRATPGEYLHQVPAVQFWGNSFMDAVNRMDKAAVVSQVAGYAYGGQVGVPSFASGGSLSAQGAVSGDTFIIDGVTLHGSDLPAAVVEWLSSVGRHAKQKAGVT